MNFNDLGQTLSTCQETLLAGSKKGSFLPLKEIDFHTVFCSWQQAIVL
jgi:hypothetical protein